MNLEELLDLHDQKFINAAYAALLGRAPDPEGNDYYLKRLRKGVEKMRIIVQIRESKEGSGRTTNLIGLDTAVKRYKARTRPLVGSVLRLIENLYKDPVADNTLRSIENKISLLQERIQTGDNSNSAVTHAAPPGMSEAPHFTPTLPRSKTLRPKRRKLVPASFSVDSEAGLSTLTRDTPTMDVLLDVEWYKTIRPACISKAAAVRDHDFHKHNVETRFSLSPYFCPIFYRIANPDIDFDLISPYDHYLQKGCSAGLDPCPLFWSAWYRKTYRIPVTEVPFLHYLAAGWSEGNAPHPLFDLDYYLSEADRVWGDPLYHYLTEGYRKGLSPNPIFDPDWYSMQIGAFDTSPLDLLSDYLVRSYDAEISPHRLFSVSFYKESITAAGEDVPIHQSLLLHYFLDGGRSDPHPLFNGSFYAKQAKLAVGSNPLSHFLTAEIPVSDPHPYFSCDYYFTMRPDVAELGVNPLIHYLKSGFAEASYPHPLFDNGFYRSRYADVSNADIPPLLHYLTSGKQQGRECRPRVEPLRTARRLANITSIEIEKTRVNLAGRDDSRNMRKGVFAHVFYPDLIDEIIGASNNVPSPCTVFITTDSLSKAKYIFEVSTKISSHPVEVRVGENRGRDIAPMLVDFRDRLSEVEFGIHIHTKKSTHYTEEFKAWRRYLIESNLGSKEIVLNILKIFDHPGIGMVAPEDYGPVANLVQWGGNLPNIIALVKMMTVQTGSISTESVLEMPTGSMFWFRSAAIKPLLDLNLETYHFDPELGQVDGTLAHAIERSFFFICEIAGFAWLRHKIVNKATKAEQNPIAYGYRVLPLNSGSSVLVGAFPETRRYSPVSSSVHKPRLNLLIPSAELSKGYAGVSEALRIFNVLKAKLVGSFDFRVISTDVSLSASDSTTGESPTVLMCDDSIDFHDVVVDGTKRAYLRLAVRRHDVFVATAWWTATACRELRQWQLAEFGSIPEKFLYLIQDYESGFYPWSTRYMLAEATYKNPEDILPIFNTNILAEFFVENGYFSSGVTYQPPMNEKIAAALDFSAKREKIVLLYVRPHALRNCLEFADALIERSLKMDPSFWSEWRFIAIGEDFNSADYLKCGRIWVHGRLSLSEYADYLSRARMGVSLMVSPHPSYPPLEMAAAGLLVLSNTYANKDLSKLHENIRSFESFDLDVVANQFRAIADESLAIVAGKSKVDWFFDAKSNVNDVADVISREVMRYVDTSGSIQ